MSSQQVVLPLPDGVCRAVVRQTDRQTAKDKVNDLLPCLFLHDYVLCVPLPPKAGGAEQGDRHSGGGVRPRPYPPPYLHHGTVAH